MHTSTDTANPAHGRRVDRTAVLAVIDHMNQLRDLPKTDPRELQNVAAELRAHLEAILPAAAEAVDALPRSDVAWSMHAGNIAYARNALADDFGALVPDHVRAWVTAHACRLLLDLVPRDPEDAR